MNVYTRKGDKGETSLFGGTRVNKSDLQVWSYGTVDEATSILGVIHASVEFENLKDIVRVIQRRMFIVAAHLASDEKGRKMLKDTIGPNDIAYLEQIIDEYTEDFGKMRNFSIPGETPVSSLFHVARTVVRRAERHMVELNQTEPLDPDVLGYINRLSDALFVLAKMEVVQSFVRKVAQRIYEIAAKAENPVNAHEYTGFDSSLCETLSKAAEAESRKIGIGSCFSIVDKSGVLVYFRRIDDSITASVEISKNKAYTAASLRIPTGELAKVCKPGDSLYGIQNTDPRIVVFGGGFPLIKNGEVIGAIGISGGSVEQDEQIAQNVLKVFNEYLNS